MRRPSDRAALWQWWRDALARKPGLRRPIEPQCGRYQAKRRGQWVAVQIDVVSTIDENGELIEDETLSAWVQGERFDEPDKVEAIWLACKNPITDEEFRRIANTPRVDDLTRSVVT